MPLRIVGRLHAAVLPWAWTVLAHPAIVLQPPQDIRLQWADASRRPAAAHATASWMERGRAVPSSSTILAEEVPGGWSRGRGRAVLLVPDAGGEKIALCTARGDNMDAVLGFRSGAEEGTLNVLHLPATDRLPAFARDWVLETIWPLMLERRIYWEATILFVGVEPRHIDRLIVRGPRTLVSDPPRWMSLLERLGADDDRQRICVGIFPFESCWQMPVGLRVQESPRLRRRINLTRRIWPRAGSTGVLVRGQLREYSSVTFEVRIKGERHAVQPALEFDPWSLLVPVASGPGSADGTRPRSSTDSPRSLRQ